MRRLPRFDLILNCSRFSESFISRGAMFHIFAPRYLSFLKPQLTVFTEPKSQFVSSGYIGYSPVQKFHALLEQLDFLLFYTALSLIILDFLYELLQNYLFLEFFQMLKHCYCNPL